MWLLFLAIVVLQSPLRATCNQIRILGAFDAAIEVTALYTPFVVEPGPNQRQVVRDGTTLFSPFLCQATTRVAYIDPTRIPLVDKILGNESGLVTNFKPDLVILSSTSDTYEEKYLDPRQSAAIAPNVRALAKRTLIHEAAHTANFLLQASDGIDDAPTDTEKAADWVFKDNKWSAAAKTKAVEIVKSNRLNGGFEKEWTRIHDAFVKGGWAEPYHNKGPGLKMTDKEIVDMGVMSVYGGDNVSDDISEMAAGILAPPAFSGPGINASPDNAACRAMQAEPGPGVPTNLAAVFTKAGFLHSVGFITDKAYDECVGKLKIRGEGSGFFSFDGGQRTNEYKQDVQGRMGKIDGGGSWFFEVEAKGSVGLEDEGTKSAAIRLTLEFAPGSEKLENVSFPRGLYHIGPSYSAFNTLQITYQDGGEMKLGIEIYEADVLIGRASHKLVEGSVFVKKYINYTELFKVPLVPKKEKLITFRKMN